MTSVVIHGWAPSAIVGLVFCDLHMHSTASDGTTAPEQLAQEARMLGLGAIALTDHDTTDGLSRCAAVCADVGIAFVPGIEVSADPALEAAPGQDGADPQRLGTLHILGLFVRHDDPMLAKIHTLMCAARNSRTPAIVAKLKQLGVRIEEADVLAIARQQGTQVIGRPHIAQVLIRKGYVKSVQDAFSQYIGQGKPAYVRRDRLPAAEAIDAIHHAGGLAILAHPIQLGLRALSELEHFVARLKLLGLDGIETRHSDHQPQQRRQYCGLASQFELLTSGGSDYHGSAKSVLMGSQQVPMAVYERLREASEPAGGRPGRGPRRPQSA